MKKFFTKEITVEDKDCWGAKTGKKKLKQS